MTDRPPRHEMTLRPLVYRTAGMDAVAVCRDVVYRVDAGRPLGIDVYTPPDAHLGSRRPAVIFVIGYSDLGAVPRFGCMFKEMQSFVDWARLVAASGMVGITYENVEPAADVRAVIAHLRDHAAELGVDAQRLGVWACSGNTPVGLSTLLADASIKIACAAFCYGLMMDVPGTSQSPTRRNSTASRMPVRGRRSTTSRKTPRSSSREPGKTRSHI